jgi:hypothetical protein
MREVAGARPKSFGVFAVIGGTVKAIFVLPAALTFQQKIFGGGFS